MFRYSKKDLDIFFYYVEDKLGDIDYVFDLENAENEKVCEVIALKKQEKDGLISNKFVTVGLCEENIDGYVSELIFDIEGNLDKEEDKISFIGFWILAVKDIVYRGEEIRIGMGLEDANEAGSRVYPHFNSIMLIPEQEEWRVAGETTIIDFFNVIGLYNEELMFKSKYGDMKLLERMAHFGSLFPLDFNRANTCIGQVKQLKISKGNIRKILDSDIAYKKCIVSDSIMIDGNKVGVCFKEESVSPESSGWIFFSGLEDENFMADLDNFDTYDIQHLLNYDEEVALLLEAEEDVIYERDASGIFTIANQSWHKDKMDEALEKALSSQAEIKEPDFIYDGSIHMYKVGAKGLDTDEINGLSHIAIYMRAMAEYGLLRDDIKEDVKAVFEEVVEKGSEYKFREYIRDNFDAMLAYDILSEEGKLFTRKYMEEAYTDEIDVYTKKRYVDEGKDPKEAHTEEYLFIDYDEAYYEYMKEWIGEKLKFFNEVILPERKKGKLSLDIIENVNEMKKNMELDGNIENLEIYSYIMDELFKKTEIGIFETQEILSDSILMSEVGQYLIDEGSFSAMIILMSLSIHSREDAFNKNNGRWFYVFGYAFMRRGFIYDAIEIFEEGIKCDPDYLMNWYYFAILSLIDRQRGKESFAEAMNVLSKHQKENYLIKTLVSELKSGIHSPKELILHMDNEDDDEKFHEKLKTGEYLTDKEFQQVKLSETMQIDKKAADSVEFIFGVELRESETGETIIVIDEENYLTVTFVMSKGVLTSLNKNFLENLNLAVASKEYRQIGGFDGRKYVLQSIEVDENYKVTLGYICLEENISCVISLNKEDREKYIFPQNMEIKDIFDENLSRYLQVHSEMN